MGVYNIDYFLRRFKTTVIINVFLNIELNATCSIIILIGVYLYVQLYKLKGFEKYYIVILK